MAPADTESLEETLSSTFALLAQFSTSLKPFTTTTTTITTIPPINPIPDAPNPLTVLRDSAKLLKAHTTKISLLSINAPFSTSAVQRIIKDLSSTCLPAMISAVQICEQEKATWGSTMLREAQWRVQRVFGELEILLKEFGSAARGNERRKRSSLNSTGVVWEACDALIGFERLGVAGLAVQMAVQWRDTIKDAIEELREWKDGEDLEGEGQDELLGSDDEGVDEDGDSIEEIFNAANSMPRDRPELVRLVGEAEGRLKRVVLLYSAVVKRRLKTYRGDVVAAKSGASSVERLDEALEGLKKLPHQVDELASCFYDLDEESAREQLEKCVAGASAVAEGLSLSWDGKEDEFTTWSGKWKEAMGD